MTEEVERELEYMRKSVERAQMYWRTDGPRVLFRNEMRLIIKRAWRLWKATRGRPNEPLR